MEYNNIKQILEKATQELEQNLVDGIIKQGLRKTGKLANSVQTSYKESNDNIISYIIRMEDYGYYQDSGVFGPLGTFSPDPKSLFAPGRFRHGKGFRPRPFIVPAVEQTLNELTTKLEQAGIKDINKELVALAQKNGALVK
jgi:hypothetical protein